MRLQALLQRPDALPVVPEVAARLIATFGRDEVDLNAVTADIAERYGFRLDPSHVALSGTCADCAAKGDATKSQHG